MLALTATAQEREVHLADRVEERVQSVMDSVPFSGIAAGIVRAGALVHHAGFGVADLDSGKPVDASTLFQIGSVTKSFTTTLMGNLIDEDLLGLETPIGDCLPSCLEVPREFRIDRVTIADLASHLSGLPADPVIPGREIDSELVLAFSHFELYKSLESVKPIGEPGEQFHYSMLGYGLLGHILELRSGRPFEILMRERVLEPLGMSGSTITLRREHLDHLAAPYHIDSRLEVEPTQTVEMGALAPAGGLASSVEDLAAFVSLHLGSVEPAKRIVSEETLAKLHERRWSFSGSLGYTLGWGTDEIPGVGPVVFHDGRCSGYTSYVGFSREHGVGVILLANLGGDATPRPFRELGHGILALAVDHD